MLALPAESVRDSACANDASDTNARHMREDAEDNGDVVATICGETKALKEAFQRSADFPRSERFRCRARASIRSRIRPHRNLLESPRQG